ncbi:MAG TPA: dienelactone hydrolase family protein [Caulobacteraceae bacterium]
MPAQRTVDYSLAGKTCQGLLVSHDAGPRPTVLVFHAWEGRTEAMGQFAERIASLGYNAFAGDIYGKGVIGSTTEECQALMNPLVGDRAKLREMLLGVVTAAVAQPEVDAGRVAAIGFCFGGLCVLDLARAGAPLRSVASFHGLFTPPGLPTVTPVKPKIIAYHGWDDPMVPPDAVVGFGKEFTEAGADWQLHAFGGAMHAFMAEGANMPEMGIQYNAVAAGRGWRALELFLAETLA